MIDIAHTEVLVESLVSRVKAIKSADGVEYPTYGGHHPLIFELESIITRLKEIDRKIFEYESGQM